MTKQSGKPFHKLSIYRKTLLWMIIMILIVFIILAVIYSFLYSRAKIEQMEIQLLSAAQAAAERVESNMDENNTSLNSTREQSYLAFMAKSTESIVWLVNSKGQVIYYSSMPKTARENLLKDEDNNIVLTKDMLNTSAIDVDGFVDIGNFHDLLPANQQWITVSYPLSGGYGYSGEVLLHYSMGESKFSMIWGEKSLWVSFLIAFVIAIGIIVFLSRNVTRPINKVVKTAEDVYHGDLQARVILHKEKEPYYIHESIDRREDDIMILVRTMNTLISKWEKQEKERDEFTASISHDLRTPLTSIKGFLGAIQDGTIHEENRQHYMNIVFQEVDRLQKLIDNLFDTTTIEQHKDLCKEVFDVEVLINEVISSLMSMINQKSIHINLDCQLSDSELSVVADRDAIQRVIYNILSNAIRFTPEQGFIRVGILPKDDERITISIEDDGEGIAREDRKHIFERFYKVNKSRNSEGSGMGLYIARNLLSMHEQSIFVGESSLGGARFTFTLDKTKARKIY
ncbi:MAG TPA: HAMP domain-containing histidine kinase [Clostridiaceae bacterium]|mgnify:CR=1 FL=1|nr:HAMP domain-containing histidine kinase [Clostridiaceae bacterium]